MGNGQEFAWPGALRPKLFPEVNFRGRVYCGNRIFGRRIRPKNDVPMMLSSIRQRWGVLIGDEGGEYSRFVMPLRRLPYRLPGSGGIDPFNGRIIIKDVELSAHRSLLRSAAHLQEPPNRGGLKKCTPLLRAGPESAIGTGLDTPEGFGVVR